MRLTPQMTETPSRANSTQSRPTSTQSSAAPHGIGLGQHAQLLKLLEELKDTQRVHTSMLNHLLKQKDGVPGLKVPEGAVFPLNTAEDVVSMETKLRDSKFKAEVVSSNPLFTSKCT